MTGLSSKEVAERKSSGLVNDTEVKTGTSYLDIFLRNLLTPFNIILFILGILLLWCEEPISAVSATGIIVVNILISTIQEMRAKRRLDKISLLTRPKVKVIRDDREVEIDQSEVVKDDLVVLRAGDQAVVDGVIVECRSLEMDESLLTGESSSVRKKVGEHIYSGSNCVLGEAYYTVTEFGTDSYASQMLSSAKKFTSKKTPLQMETGTVTKLLMAIAAVLFVITIIKSLFVTHESFGETLEVFVLCLDVVPIALFLLITITYMMAAMRMADTGVLLQRSNSVESISHVDTVCMDKTGTITTNRLCFESAENFIDECEVARLASIFVGTTGSRNRTVEALAEKYGESGAELVEEVQFSSERKYSAVRVRDEDGTVTLYLGAYSSLKGLIESDTDIEAIVSRESRKGLRTVVFCKGGDDSILDGDAPAPGRMTPVSVFSIRDEVRPDCRDTIQVFLDNGMDLKVISGDDPVTVDSLFTVAGIPGERKIVSGPELDAMSDAEFNQAALDCNIFGRMKPENKEKVIEALKNNGRYVAMVGDGVNDVKSLKTAQVGISLESGAGAARGVADMILVKDNFSALPKALVEGRRTVSGMRDILKLYLTRNFTLAILVLVIYVFLGNIPMIPIQNTFYAFISVTIMAFFMTVFAKPDENKELILPDVLRYCIPSSIMIAVFCLLVYGATWMAVSDGIITIDYEAIAATIGFVGDPESTLTLGEQIIDRLSWNGSGPEEIAARSAMVLFASIAGLLQIFIICPRWKFMSADGRTNKSLVPVVITLLIAALVIAMYAFFPVIAVELVGLTLFPTWCYGAMLVVIAVLLVLEVLVFRRNVFGKLIQRFEDYYMEKLREEYSEGDVIEETGPGLKARK